MTNLSRNKQIKTWSGLALGILLSTVQPARASDDFTPDGISGDYGTGNETRIARLNAQWDWTQSWFENGSTHLTGYWDASIAAWEARSWQGINGHDRTIADVGFTPIFRYEGTNRRGWYLDAGVGPNILSRLYENHRRDFSTAFQFGDLIGVGYQFERWQAGIILEHYSNGAIKHPNPGANFALLEIAYRFQPR